MKKKTLLIAEDDIDLERMYKEILQHRGWRVLSATDGEKTINLALAHNPDAILLDLMLPKKGGLHALKILRSLPETRSIPIIVVTAYPNPEYREEAGKSNIQGYFLKSEVSHAQLAEAIEKIVDHKQG